MLIKFSIKCAELLKLDEENLGKTPKNVFFKHFSNFLETMSFKIFSNSMGREI